MSAMYDSEQGEYLRPLPRPYRSLTIFFRERLVCTHLEDATLGRIECGKTFTGASAQKRYEAHYREKHQ